MSRHKRFNKERTIATVVLLLPVIVFFLLFIARPLLTSICYAFMEVKVVRGGVETTFVGLSNFKAILQDEVFKKAAGNTIIWAIASPLLEIPLGLLLALVLKTRLKGYRFFRAAWFAPVLMPQVAVGIVWAWLLNSEWGLVNELLSAIGLENLTRAWLGNPDTALGSLIFITTWIWTGFNMVLMTTAISTVSDDILEAATIDGASYWKTVVRIVLPMIWPMIVNALILCFIGKMKVYDLIYVTTKGGPAWATETVATYTVERAFNWSFIERGYPSAMATLWFAVILIVTVVSNRAAKKSYME